MTWFLDYNAGAARDPRVRAYMESLPAEAEANPSSQHSVGRKARALLEEARERVAQSLGVSANEIVFCSGGTEANNIAALTGYHHARQVGKPIAISPIEHPSMARSLAALLTADGGCPGFNLDIGADGRARIPNDDEAAGFVSLIHSQHETGVLQEPARLVPWARGSGAILHCDASQSLGRVPISDVVREFDLVTFSPHKCGGPKGIGVLYVRAGCGVQSLLKGGQQEMGRRPGTQAVGLALGAAYAMELASRECDSRASAMQDALSVFLDGVLDQECCTLLFNDAERLPNTACLETTPVQASHLLPALDLDGLCLSFGSACSSGAFQASPALLASGLSEERALCCLRVSVGPLERATEMQEAARLFGERLSRIRQIASGLSFDSRSDGG